MLLSCFFIVLILILSSCTVLIARSNKNFFVGVKNGFFIRQLTHIFSSSRNDLKGETDDRINFLLMGIGGPGHEGPYLTDTIILASFKPSTKEAAMISVPRDLIVPTGNGIYMKVNSVYALHLKNGSEEAFRITKKIIGDAFGLNIQYMGVVDFQGFIRLVDTIGGITVDVERDFTDPLFPVAENQVQTVTFRKGTQTMNGKTALVYARSRHGNNGEGSDFARSKRQQKIILATKKKISSFDTLFNPRKLTQLFDLINEYTRTDIEPWEIVKLVQLAKNISPDNIGTVVFDDTSGSYLQSGISSVDGAYILQPISGSYAQLQALAQNVFQETGLKKEHPNVIVLNGTKIPNAAGTLSTLLDRLGIKPLAVGNATRQDKPVTELYDYTGGKKPETRTLLESVLGIQAQTFIPLDLLGTALAKQLNLTDASGEYQEPDFLVLLGSDVQTVKQRQLIRTLTSAELAATSTAPLPTSTDLFLPNQ